MTGVLPAMALPSGTDPDSLLWQTPSPIETGSAPVQLSYQVPSGEIWLVLSISAKTTSVAPGNTQGFIGITPSGPAGTQDIYQAASAQQLPAPSTYYTTATQDWSSFSQAGINQPSINMQLPPILLLPGWIIYMTSMINGAGSVSFDHINNYASVASWEWGGNVATGRTSQVPIGPFMLVPGPNEAAVAA